MNASKIRCDMIKTIQARGYRVLILQSRAVQLWRKGEPDRVWELDCLTFAEWITKPEGRGLV
jgi:hypothetical protein